MSGFDFAKMVASGNSFVVIRKSPRANVRSPQELASRICDRNSGVGADGLLIIEPSEEADFKMRIFNPDGSEAEMCGNGARCVALYAKQNKIAGGDMRIETLAGIIEAGVNGNNVKLKMSEPKDIKLDVNIAVEDRDLTLNFVNSGVPHVVLFVDDIDKQDVKGLGGKIRRHSAFAPRGTNVNFVESRRGNSLRLRTYERGVEDETLACGTGAVASAIISAVVKGLKSPVTCVTKSGDKLKVYFLRSRDNFKDVYLEGGADFVFCGRYPGAL